VTARHNAEETMHQTTQDDKAATVIFGEQLNLIVSKINTLVNGFGNQSIQRSEMSENITETIDNEEAKRRHTLTQPKALCSAGFPDSAAKFSHQRVSLGGHGRVNTQVTTTAEAQHLIRDETPKDNRRTEHLDPVLFEKEKVFQLMLDSSRLES
jgi:hypothetical protein